MKSVVFFEAYDVLEEPYIAGQRWQLTISCAPKKGSIFFGWAPKRRAREATEIANNSPTRCGWNIWKVQQLCVGPQGKWQRRTMYRLARLNKVLIRPIHRGLMLNNILSRPVGVKYLKLIDVSSGYHNLKLDDKSSYLTSFVSIFQVSICKTAIWSSHGSRYVPELNRWII